MRQLYFRLSALTVAFAVSALGGSAQPAPLLGFDFNEGQGAQVTDLSGQHIGTFGIEEDPDAYMDFTAGPSGADDDYAALFNGRSQLFANLGTDATLTDIHTGPITAEAWVLPNSFDETWIDIFRYGNTYKLGFNNGNLLFTHLAIADYFSNIPVEVGEWNHVAAVWEPGFGIIFYINGEEVAFSATENIARAPVNTQLWVGSGGNASYFNGAIDRLRIHNAVLEEDELDSDAANPKPAFDSTVLHLDFAGQSFANGAGADITLVDGEANLVANSMPVWSEDSATGLPGEFSLYFNGAGSRVIVPDPNLDFQFWGEEFTLEAYVKYDTLPNTRAIIFSYGVPGQGGYSFSVTRDDHAGGDYRVGRKVFVTTYGILDANNNSEIPDDGEWHHVAVVHDAVGQELRFYVDGELGDSRAYSSGVNFTEERNALYVGIEGAPGSRGAGLPFRGYIDRIRLHDAALSAAESDIVERVSVNNWNLY